MTDEFGKIDNGEKSRLKTWIQDDGTLYKEISALKITPQYVIVNFFKMIEGFSNTTPQPNFVGGPLVSWYCSLKKMNYDIISIDKPLFATQKFEYRDTVGFALVLTACS